MSNNSNIPVNNLRPDRLKIIKIASRVFLLIILPIISTAQVSPPTINVCDGDQTICLTGPTYDLCVQLTVQAGSPVINHFEIDWGDNSTITTVPGSQSPADQQHLYNLIDFYNKCDAEEKFTVELLTYYNGDPEPKNNSFVVRFKNKPIPNFTYDNPSCKGVDIDINNNTCENAPVATYSWTFGDGTISTLENPIKSYTSTGIYTIQLCATNECGDACIQKQVLVIDRPNIIALSSTILSGCIPFTTKLSANATGINSNGYEWKVISSPNGCTSCVQFIPVTGKDSIMPVLQVTLEGMYTIRLIGSNECGNDTATIQLNASAQPNLTVGIIPAGCNSLTVDFNDQLLDYQGTITTYNWTFPVGSSITSYTSTLPGNVTFTQSGTVLVELRGPCDTIIKQIQIVVNSQAPISFSALPQSICVTTSPFNLAATPAGGTFTGPGITNMVLGTFNPVLAGVGTHTITYKQGVQGCESQGTVTIIVLPADVLTIGGNIPVCRDEPQIPLNANLVPGIWSGTGVTGNNFSPGNAMVGPNTITYEYTNSAGCKSSASRVITVVPIPLAHVPDTLFSCDIASPVNLTTLGGITFTPGLSTAGSAVTWTGNGVNGAGMFTSPGVGVYTVSLNYLIPPMCDTTVSFKISVADFVSANAGPDTVLCSGQGIYNITGFPTGGLWRNSSGTIVTPAIDLNTLTAGNHTFSYTIQSSSPCESSDLVTLTIIDANAVTAGADRYICETETNLALPIMAGLSWSGPSLAGNNIDVSALSPGTYAYTITNPGLPVACNHDEFTLTVSPQPSGDFTLSQDTSCVGKTVTIFPMSSTGVGSVDWGDGVINNSLTHQYGTKGDYLITLTITTTNPLTSQVLCTASSVRHIHIIEPILINNIKFMMDTMSGCAVLTVHFTNLSQAEGGIYFWNFGNGQTYAGFSPPAVDFQQGTEDTIYTISLTVKNGCDSISISKEVKVFPQPSAKMGISYLQPCTGGVLKASVLSTGNPETDTFYTTTGLIRQGSTSAPTYFQFFTDSLPKTVGIWLVTTNFCGHDTAYQEVVVNPTDVVAVIGLPDTTRLCVGSSFTLINYGTTGAPVDWTFSNGNTYTGDTIQITADQEGTYYIILKVFGCGFDSMMVPVYIKPLPEIMVTYDPQKCPHLPVQFKVTSDAPNLVLWYGDGDSTLQKTSQHLFPGPGLFLPSAQAVSEAGCVGKWDGQLTILTPPAAQIAATDSVCVDEPVLFTGSADQDNITYVWTFGDGNISDMPMPAHAYSTPGLFTTVLTVISNEGCIDTAAIPIYVRTRPDANFTYAIKEKCTPAVVDLSNSSAGATGLIWTLGDGATSTAAQFEHIYYTGQIWPVQLIATNEGICSDTVLKLIPVFQTPLLDLLTKIQCTIAEGVNLTIQTPAENFVEVSAQDYYQSGNYHTALQKGDYHINIKTPEGCVNDTSIVILPVNELYLKVAQDSFLILQGDSIQLEANVNQTGVSFTWTPPVYLDDATIFNPESKPWRTTDYVVRGIDINGCPKYDTVYIRVIIDRDSSLFIPNAFSPNGDGNNDVFYVRNQFNPSVKGLEMFKIFDKFGEKMFDIDDLPGRKPAPTENPFYGWDGTFRGEKAEAGTYYFQIKVSYIDDFIASFKGALILIR